MVPIDARSTNVMEMIRRAERPRPGTAPHVTPPRPDKPDEAPWPGPPVVPDGVPSPVAPPGHIEPDRVKSPPPGPPDP
jgi:hypothetical protein